MHASRRETKRYAGRSQHLARHLQLPRALGQPSLLPPNPLSTPTELSQPVLQFPRGGDPWKCGMDTYFPREITTGDLLVDSRKSTRDASNCFIHRANFSNIARKLRSSKERKGQEFSSHELLSKFVQHQDQKARGFVAVIKQEIAVGKQRRGENYAVRCLRSFSQKIDQQSWISWRVTATQNYLPRLGRRSPSRY